jgi:hypothetical protein
VIFPVVCGDAGATMRIVRPDRSDDQPGIE